MRGLAVLVAAAFAAGTAQAATVTFRVAGMCQTNCEQVGTFDDSAVGGRVVLDDAGFAAGGAIDASAFVDFLIIFGDVDYGRATAPVVGASGVWGATPDDPRLGLRLAAGPSDPSVGFAFAFSVGMPGEPSRFLASTHGSCVGGPGAPCVTITAAASDLATASGPAVRSITAPIPAPPALGLLLGGLATLGLLGRRRLGGPARAGRPLA
jgi:hypothetical protein